MKLFKTIVVNDKNIDLIKSKLVASTARRLELLKVPKLDFLEHFPFFFFRPELVRIAKPKNSPISFVIDGKM